MLAKGNRTRAKLQTSDNNHIDTLFVDNREGSADHGKKLVCRHYHHWIHLILDTVMICFYDLYYRDVQHINLQKRLSKGLGHFL